MDTFTQQEVNQMIEATANQFRNMLIFQFYAGTRPSEMIALQWDDIDFEKKKIKIRNSHKTYKNRVIEMTPRVEVALRDQIKYSLELSKNVFIMKSKKPFSDTHSLEVQLGWKEFLVQCNLMYRKFQNTRSTFAQIHAMEGKDQRWIEQMLGHTSTLQFYTSSKCL